MTELVALTSCELPLPTMMKVNLKLKGSNYTVCDTAKAPIEGKLRDKLYRNPPGRSVMILGADVTHPSGGSLTGCPSVAALVGSVDFVGGRFLGSMRLQERSKKEVCLPLQKWSKCTDIR